MGLRATQPIPAACYHYTHGDHHISDEIKHKNTRTPARLISTRSTLLMECRTGNLVARLVGMKMNRIAIETGATLKSRPCFSAAFRPYVILRYTSYLMVGVRGFEPPTSSSRTKRASHCATPRLYTPRRAANRSRDWAGLCWGNSIIPQRVHVGLTGTAESGRRIKTVVRQAYPERT